MHSLNRNKNLMGFDTIEINLVIYIVALMFTHFTNMWMNTLSEKGVLLYDI